MRNFCIIGNGCTGSTFLHNVFEEHPSINMMFEPRRKSFAESLELYKRESAEANNRGKTWGMKLPFEQVMWRADFWKPEDFIELARNFHIIGTFRNFESWLKSWNRRQIPAISRETALDRWDRGNRIIEGLDVLTVVNYHEYMVDFDNITAINYNLLEVDATFKPTTRPNPKLSWFNEVSTV